MSRALEALALHGGTPVRALMLPYGRQTIDDADIAAVVEVLRSDWLTTGPRVAQFEQAFAEICEVEHAVAVSSGTAALHAAVHALGIGPGDEVIVPAMTFAATANCVVMEGAEPVFADVEGDTLLIDPEDVRRKISSKTKAIISVDYAGQACDYEALGEIANENGLAIVDDASHSLGGRYRGRPVGVAADLSTFSLHPVKHITSGEGGVIVTDDERFAERMRTFRNHGITSDHRQRERAGTWFYEMVELGNNYRLTDFQCALAFSQLSKLREWIARRQQLAAHYTEALVDLPGVCPLEVREDVSHAYHLYVVRLDTERLGMSRREIFTALRAENIGVAVHYIPVHLHPFYQERYGTSRGDFPVAEAAYEQIISLPLFPAMSLADVDDVMTALVKVLGDARK